MYPLMAWELTKHLAHIALLLCKISCWLTVPHSLLPTHLLLHILFLPLVLLVLFLPWVCLCSSHPLPATLQTSPSFKYFTFFTVGLLKPSLQFQWGTHFSSSPKDILPNNLKLLSPHDSVMYSINNVLDKLYCAELRNYMVKSSCSHIMHRVYFCAWKISKLTLPALSHWEGRLLRAVQAHRGKEVAGRKQIWLTKQVSPIVIFSLLFLWSYQDVL